MARSCNFSSIRNPPILNLTVALLILENVENLAKMSLLNGGDVRLQKSKLIPLLCQLEVLIPVFTTEVWPWQI